MLDSESYFYSLCGHLYKTKDKIKGHEDTLHGQNYVVGAPLKKRKCLRCRKIFTSHGNRTCGSCSAQNQRYGSLISAV